jgi:hypothetical protein
MKKTSYIPYLTLLVILVNLPSVFAGTPALVPSIRGDAILNISTVLDADTSAVFIYAGDISTDTPLTITEVTSVLKRVTTGSSTEISAHTIDDIVSDNDLQEYIKDLINHNPDLIAVVVDGNNIVMTRTISGTYLGLISLPVKETAEVTNWGGGGSEVNISSPWWNIFSKQYSDDQITKKLYVKIKTIPTALFGTTLDSQTQGRILSKIESTFNENNSYQVK